MRTRRLTAGSRCRHASGRAPPSHLLIVELERAGLRGYGGAGFPTATKLNAVAARGTHPTVLVNCSEGEPLSSKDVLLVSRLPHLVIDGALVAASVLGSDRIVFALDEHARGAARAVKQALAEREELQYRGTPAVSVNAVPSGYLIGQETALVNVLDGGPPLPTATPPYPFQRGLRGRPTLVSNTETLAQLALIARHGAGWFRALGTAGDPGTRLVTVSGAVNYPGVRRDRGRHDPRPVDQGLRWFGCAVGRRAAGRLCGQLAGPDAVDLRLDARAAARARPEPRQRHRFPAPGIGVHRR